MEVTVANSVLPVEVSNADPIPVTDAPTATPPSKFFACLGGEGTLNQFTNIVCPVSQDVVIQHVSLQVTATASANDLSPCQALVSVNRASSVMAYLARAETRVGHTTSVSIPMPNISLSAADDDNVVVSMNNTTGVRCQLNWVITGVKVP